MHILFIVEHYYPYIGGAEELWKSLAEQLVLKNNNVTVLTTRFDKNLAQKETINGVDIVRLNVSNRFSFTFFSLPTAIRLSKLADIIHTSSYNAALPAWLAAKLTSKKCIITFHEVWGKLWFQLPDISILHRYVYYLFERMLLNLNFDKFVAVSDFTLLALRETGVKENLCTRIYNGLDYSKFKISLAEPPRENFVFCYYGRLGLSKGYQFLIPAISKIKKSHPSIKLKFIVPKQPAKALEKLKSEISDLKLNDNVIWLHDLEKSDLYKEVATSHAVIIPSLSEGFCYVAAETVALKVPIISSQRGALQEVVGGHFITIPTLTVEGLTEAMILAINKRWEQLPSKEFPLNDTIEQYENLYRELL